MLIEGLFLILVVMFLIGGYLFIDFMDYGGKL